MSLSSSAGGDADWLLDNALLSVSRTYIDSLFLLAVVLRHSLVLLHAILFQWFVQFWHGKYFDTGYPLKD